MPLAQSYFVIGKRTIDVVRYSMTLGAARDLAGARWRKGLHSRPRHAQFLPPFTRCLPRGSITTARPSPPKSRNCWAAHSPTHSKKQLGCPIDLDPRAVFRRKVVPRMEPARSPHPKPSTRNSPTTQLGKIYCPLYTHIMDELFIMTD